MLKKITSKSRLIEYMSIMGITKPDFYKKTGLANGFLDKGDEITSLNLRKISSAFLGLNLTWLVTGEGEMLRKSEKNGDNGIVQIGKNSNNIVNTGTLLKNNANKSVYNEKKKECEICELCEAKERIIAEKERIIAEKNEVVEALKNQIELYKELLKK